MNALEHVKPQVEAKDYSVDDIVIPALGPRLIALHAACARTAHRLDAADYLEERYRDMEEIVMMNQPVAAYELTRALKTLQMFADLHALGAHLRLVMLIPVRIPPAVATHTFKCL